MNVFKHQSDLKPSPIILSVLKLPLLPSNRLPTSAVGCGDRFLPHPYKHRGCRSPTGFALLFVISPTICSFSYFQRISARQIAI